MNCFKRILPAFIIALFLACSGDFKEITDEERQARLPQLSSSSEAVSSSGSADLVSCSVNGFCWDINEDMCSAMPGGTVVDNCPASSSSSFNAGSASSSSGVVASSSSHLDDHTFCIVGNICSSVPESFCSYAQGEQVPSCPISSSSVFQSSNSSSSEGDASSSSSDEVTGSSSSNTAPSSSSATQSSSSAPPSSSSIAPSSSSVALPSSSSATPSSSSLAISSSSVCTASDNTETQYCSDGVMKNYGYVTLNSKTYKTVVIGTQTWMAENLGSYTWIGAMNLGSNCTSNSCSSQISANHQGVCPQGWHIPSRDEWLTLISYANPDSEKKLKATNSNGTDNFGFSAQVNRWWSSTSDAPGHTGASCMNITATNAVVSSGYSKESSLGVRCLKN